MNDDQRPVAVADVQTRDLGDEFLVYDLRGDRVHVLNGSAREIFRLSDGSRTVNELAAALVRAFEVDEDTAARDTRDAVRQLVDLGLLRIS